MSIREWIILYLHLGTDMKSSSLWDTTPCTLPKVNRVSKDYITSIFTVKESNMKQAPIISPLDTCFI
jgi:hypothetical protein